MSAFARLLGSRLRQDGEDLSASPDRTDLDNDASIALPAVSADGAGEVILVVEDDPMMLKFTTEAVRELGYTVVHAGNATAALAILDSRPDIKLLFTDVVMPDVSGKKLAVEEAAGFQGALPTGYTANAVVHGGVLDAGVNLLGKPFTLERLAVKLRLLLDQ